MTESSATALVSTLDEALDLLRPYRTDDPAGRTPAEPLPSLLDQCEAALATIAGPPPLRSIHHMACTGGTLISRCLAALPNTVLLSEIDPLSRMHMSEVPHFSPTDLLRGFRQSVRPVSEDDLIAIFAAAVETASQRLGAKGQHLIIRDHAHSHFATDTNPDTRPTLHEMLAALGRVCSVVTVRHPLDSFLALLVPGWEKHLEPPTLGEYARRYTLFLDRHAGLPIVTYEDFVADPDGKLQQLSALLDLPYHPLATQFIDAVTLTGDSGRTGSVIAPRPRRPVPEAVEAQRQESPAYQALCARLGYTP